MACVLFERYAPDNPFLPHRCPESHFIAEQRGTPILLGGSLPGSTAPLRSRHGTRLRLGAAVAKLSRSLLRAPKDRRLVG